MTNIPFPPTIYEGYYHTGRSGWVSCEDSFSEDLGICTAAVAEQADRFDAEWIVRRTDHDPDTGMIEASAYVDQDEAATAGEKYCADMEFDIPPSIRSGKYDTIEDIRDSDGERRADEARIEGDAA